MPLGYLAFVLHAHLPFVRHPEHEDFLEEDWLFEAITETYVPLLEMFDELDRDGVDWRLTMSISPTLAAMLSDPLLQYRAVRYIDNRITLTTRELSRTRWQPEFQQVAEMYMNRFTRCRDIFVNRWNHNLLTGFRHFAQTGRLELITCAATHSFFPLMGNNLPAMRAQIQTGVSEFQRHFGFAPRGIWLPECGYLPGLDRLLAEAGLQYFFMDTHGVVLAEPKPRYGVYAPIRCPETGVCAFGRDTESSRQVWSAVEGYPGDYAYREFYRDIGFDLDLGYLKPHLHDGERHYTGIKYYRITGRTENKLPYDPALARERAAEHATNFLFNRSKQVEWLSGAMNDRPALLVAPYDAELFGHWWFEGPEWLGFLLRRMCFDQETLQGVTISEYLNRHNQVQQSQPVFSSWGQGGYSEVWLNATNDWVYPHLHEAALRMTELVEEHPQPTPLQKRILMQAGRELMLAQSSDWAFILKAETTVEYAVKRIQTHLTNFLLLQEMLQKGPTDEIALAEMERRQNLFPEIDINWWKSEGAVAQTT